MKLTFRSDALRRLYIEQDFRGAFHPQIVRVYRMRIQYLIRARDERDIRAMKSLRYEKLSGNRKHQRSIRINDQMRIVMELTGSGDDREIEIVAIEDYH